MIGLFLFIVAGGAIMLATLTWTIYIAVLTVLALIEYLRRYSENSQR